MATNFQVIAAAPNWALNGVNIFSANLVRTLTAAGVDARILLTEDGSPLVSPSACAMPLPSDLRVDRLPVATPETWGGRWGAMIRYLEERSPCIYIPNADWRHSNICSQLKSAVKVVGIVHSDDPMHYDHVERLGRYWDAVVTTSGVIATEVKQRWPRLADRVLTIPVGVSVPPVQPVRQPPAADVPLRLVYQGSLQQHQKRIFDLIRIVEQCSRRGIPVELTLIGDGVDRERLVQQSRSLMELGLVRFMGLRPHDEVLRLLPAFDIYLLASEFEGSPNALAEAMAHGCVPVVSDIRSGVRDLVRNGETGFLAPVGVIDAFVDHLARLQRDPELRYAVSARAAQTIASGAWSLEYMGRRYLELFEQLFSQSRFQRPSGVTLRQPPLAVAGTRIFYQDGAAHLPGVGVFRWQGDYAAYQRELAATRGRDLPAWQPQSAKPYPNAILSATSGRLSGVDIFAANLAKTLTSMGRAAHVLMTDPGELTPDPMPLPAGTPVHVLPANDADSWPVRWRRLQAYLEQHAPCLYIPNYDWRHSCISPLLPDSVGIVGIVHSDDPMHYEHVRRLGPYWNAIVAVSPLIAGKVVAEQPELASRVVTIPYGVAIPEHGVVRPLRPAGEPLRIIYAGRLVQEQKRVRDLAAIFGTLHARGVKATLTVAGGGVEEAWLRQALAQGLAAGLVRFTGTLANEQVLAEFDRHDVFLLTSEFEGLPVSLLEAMARGCVPVVTDIRSGVPELVRSGENGYVVPVGGIAAFADRLTLLADDPSAVQAMSRLSHEATRRAGCGLDDMAAAYLNLFERVLVEAELGEFRRPRGKILLPPGMDESALREHGAVERLRRNLRRRVRRVWSRLG